MVGPKHVMGLAVGNELELLHNHVPRHELYLSCSPGRHQDVYTPEFVNVLVFWARISGDSCQMGPQERKAAKLVEFV